MEAAASNMDHAPMEEDAAPASMVEMNAEELEVADILSDLSRLIRSRDPQERRRERRERHRRRLVQRDDNPSPEPAPAAASTAVPSPETPLAYPQSGGDDDAPPKDKGEAAAAVRPRDQSAEQQYGEEAAASSGQAPENARPLTVATRKKKDTPWTVPSRDLTDERLLEWAKTVEDRYLQAMAKKQKAAARRRRVGILRAKGLSLVSRRMWRAS
ncbi:hypothetical protein ZEAMMB73_Zm00001d015040 [Zea mays]|nr:hypothetical protein ZEAMMB73_Zm00001d015040 [Zea mays]